jgi:hypothetical protein
MVAMIAPVEFHHRRLTHRRKAWWFAGARFDGPAYAGEPRPMPAQPYAYACNWRRSTAESESEAGRVDFAPTAGVSNSSNIGKIIAMVFRTHDKGGVPGVAENKCLSLTRKTW